MHKRVVPGLTATLTAGILLSPAARAADAEAGLLNDTFNVSVGTFILSTDTRVRVDGTAGMSDTDVSLNRDLGFRDDNRFRADATWRFARRHKLRAMYFSLNQSADKTIDRDLTIGDTVYEANAELHSHHDTTIAELAYEYAMWRGESYEVTLSAGLHMVKFKFNVSGEGTVNGQGGQFSTESATTTAPLPVFGIRGLWEFSRGWYLDAQAQYFGLKVDSIDGHLTDLRCGVTKMFGSHFGLGAAWNQFVTKVNLSQDDFSGSLRYRYSGAQVYATASF